MLYSHKSYHLRRYSEPDILPERVMRRLALLFSAPAASSILFGIGGAIYWKVTGTEPKPWPPFWLGIAAFTGFVSWVFDSVYVEMKSKRLTEGP